MRIDIAAHLGHWPFQRLRATSAPDLLADMDRSAVDLALVSNLNGLFYADCQAANEELAQWLKDQSAARDRLLPLAVVNPTYPGWKRDLARCRSSLGMRGLRLYPQYHGYDLRHAACADLLRTARDLGWPVFFSLRMIDARGRSWLDTQKVQADTEQLLIGDLDPVLATPGLKIVILQSYFQNLPKTTETLLQGASVLFDTSRASGLDVGAFNAYDLKAEMARFGLSKFAFGSMTPFVDPISPFLRLEAAGLPAATRDAIWSENARRFFDL